METPSPQKNGKPAPSRLLDTQNVISFVMSLVDRVADPQTRQRIFTAVFKFSYQRPVLASFIALQSLFALFPIACFVGFAVSTILFCATTAIGFALFGIGVAGIILFWAVLISFTLAASTWLYLAFCYISIRYIGTLTGFISQPSTALVPAKPTNIQNPATPRKPNRPPPKRKPSLADEIPVPAHPKTNPLDPNGVSDELATYPERKNRVVNGTSHEHWEEEANPLDPNALPDVVSNGSSTAGDEHGEMWEKIKHEGDPMRMLHVESGIHEGDLGRRIPVQVL